LLVAALPHSKALTETAYSVALVLWLAKLLVRRERPRAQPLVPAMLAVLLCSAISCLLSPVPAFSWGPMKSVVLLLAGALYAQNIRSLPQVKTLVIVLCLSTLGAIGYTAWQYTYGIGAKVVNVAPGTSLAQAGIQAGDIVMSIDGHRVHNPGEARRTLRRLNAQRKVSLLLGRGEGLGSIRAQVERQDVAATTLDVGRPPRALGGLNHAVTYALVLLQIGLLVWGLLLSATLARQKLKWTLFAGLILICATMGATGTRASLVSMAVAGVLALWVAVPQPWIRSLGLATVILAMLAASLWIRHERGLGMVAPQDDGTRYRVLMWEDGLRLTLQHPWFGVGMDSIEVLWPQWNIRAYRQFPAFRTNFHSTLVQIAAERGLVTLAAYIWLMFLCVRLPLRLVRQLPIGNWFARGFALGAFGAAIGFLSSSLVNYNGSEMHILFWFFIGTTVAMQNFYSYRPDPPAENH
jgi:O-antigen ligase